MTKHATVANAPVITRERIAEAVERLIAALDAYDREDELEGDEAENEVDPADHEVGEDEYEKDDSDWESECQRVSGGQGV